MLADPPVVRKAGGAGIGDRLGSPGRRTGAVQGEFRLIGLEVVPVRQEGDLRAVLRQRKLFVAPFAFEDRALRHVVQRYDPGAVARSIFRGGGKGKNGGFLREPVVVNQLVTYLAVRRQVQEDQRGAVLLLVVGVALVGGALSFGGRPSLGGVRVILLDGHVRQPAFLANDLVTLYRTEVGDPRELGFRALEHPRDVRHRERVFRQVVFLLAFPLEGVDLRFRRRDREDEIAGVRCEGRARSPHRQCRSVPGRRLERERRVALHGRDDERQPVAIGRQRRVIDRLPLKHVLVVQHPLLRGGGRGGAEQQDQGDGGSDGSACAWTFHRFISRRRREYSHLVDP